MIHAAVVAGAVIMADLVHRGTAESVGHGRVVTGFVHRVAQVTVDGQHRDQAEQHHAQQPPMVALRNRLTTHDHRL
jgi:hypothetical protein